MNSLRAATFSIILLLNTLLVACGEDETSSDSVFQMRPNLPTPATTASLPEPVATLQPVAEATVTPLDNETEQRRAQPRILVQPDAALIDTPVDLRLAGFPPDQPVTVRARMRDDLKQVWESEATFVTDSDGRLDIGAQRPLSGSYDTIDEMGLFWSMVPQGNWTEPPLFANQQLTPLTVQLTAEVGGEVLARRVIGRLRMAPDVVRIPVRESGLFGTLFQPPGDGPFPTVIVLGGAEGGLSESRAALLASHGYAALALAYFGIGPLPPTLVHIPLEYFRSAYDWLGTQEAIDVERVALVGFSRGGEAALLLGATYPWVKAVAAFVPSGVALGGFSQDGRPVAAWTFGGVPVPFIQADGGGSLAAAIIRVENINGPVLLISGQNDAVWNSTALSELAFARLVEYQHPYPYHHLRYENAGHAILFPYLPTTDKLLGLGGTAQGNAHANADAWHRLLELLAERLDVPASESP